MEAATVREASLPGLGSAGVQHRARWVCCREDPLGESCRQVGHLFAGTGSDTEDAGPGR